jgi:hypothetical protein
MGDARTALPRFDSSARNGRKARSARSGIAARQIPKGRWTYTEEEMHNQPMTQADGVAVEDTPVSLLRNALQILVLAGPNWVTPVQAFAVREGIEAALAKMAPTPKTETCWDCGSEYTPSFPTQRECTRCYVAGKL